MTLLPPPWLALPLPVYTTGLTAAGYRLWGAGYAAAGPVGAPAAAACELAAQATERVGAALAWPWVAGMLAGR